MKIHEYQARQILSDHGIAVPPAEVVRSPEEAADAFKKIGQAMAVVKAQVYAGGRGKAGFVKLVRSADEARDAAKFMLTHRMTSYQTGPEGVPVSVLLVAPGVDIAREFYLGITIDRTRNTATMIASAEGGVEIEEVAKKSPKKSSRSRCIRCSASRAIRRATWRTSSVSRTRWPAKPPGS